MLRKNNNLDPSKIPNKVQLKKFLLLAYIKPLNLVLHYLKTNKSAHRTFLISCGGNLYNNLALEVQEM